MVLFDLRKQDGYQFSSSADFTNKQTFPKHFRHMHS